MSAPAAARRRRVCLSNRTACERLQAISEAGAVRIRDLSDLTQIPRQPINSLMQYLKRKQLVAKAGLEFDAPYALTDQGRAVLAEITLRQAA